MSLESMQSPWPAAVDMLGVTLTNPWARVNFEKACLGNFEM